MPFSSRRYERKIAIIDLPELRERTGVFRDRAHAGKILADMLVDFKEVDGLILAIPAGGVPVGVEIAKQLDLLFDLAAFTTERLAHLSGMYLDNHGVDGFVYIGDSDHDAEAAKAAGGAFILVNTRDYDEEHMRRLEPRAVISDISELPDALRSLGYT